MSKLQKEYDKLVECRKKIIEELKSLEKSKIVKRYLDLNKQNENLYNEEINLYGSIKEEEYKSCKHVLVYTKIDYDKYEGRKYRSCGCIKCGLDNSILDYDKKYLSPYGKIMYTYLSQNYLRGIETKVACDIDLARAIYSKIKEKHSNIDDKIAIKYFEIALDNIRNIKVNNDRKESRAKRLSLKPNFKRWNSDDV